MLPFRSVPHHPPKILTAEVAVILGAHPNGTHGEDNTKGFSTVGLKSLFAVQARQCYPYTRPDTSSICSLLYMDRPTVWDSHDEALKRLLARGDEGRSSWSIRAVGAKVGVFYP